MNGPWEEHRIDVTNRLGNLEKGQAELRRDFAKVAPNIAVLQARMAFIGAAAAVIVTVALWLLSQLAPLGSGGPAEGLAPFGENCSESYPGFCVAPAPPDLDCADVPHKDFVVLQPDPHGFDADEDGIGCETYR